jgi:hypothetical protein
MFQLWSLSDIIVSIIEQKPAEKLDKLIIKVISTNIVLRAINLIYDFY